MSDILFQFNKRKNVNGVTHVYPMSCAAFTEDVDELLQKRRRLTILSAQPLGIKAENLPGRLTIFLDRHLSNDDGKGLQQGIVDNIPSRSLFRILVEELPISNQASDRVI